MNDARFWAKVKICAPDECWEWQGWFYPNGYGGLKLPIDGREEYLAHRYSYRIHAKRSIPDDRCIMHTCDNRKCVNPAHLVLGTHQENIADRDAKRRLAYGERQGPAKLNDRKVVAMRQLRDSGVMLKDLAKQFGVGTSTVHRVVTKTHWRHVSAEN